MIRFGIRVIWLLIVIGIYHPVEGADTISFEEILQDAIANSYQLKISDIDISISKYAVKELTSLYFPTLNVRFNSEYLKDLTGGVTRVTPIGNIVLSENTMFQDSLCLNLSYHLLGTRRGRCLLAKKEVEQSKLIYRKNLKDLKLRILELYTQLLLTYKELEAKKEILLLEQELLQLKERLFKAGTISKIEIAEQAIRLAEVMEEINRVKTNLLLVLEDVTFYTWERYDLDVRVLDFKSQEEKIKISKLPVSNPEVRIYDVEIEKKKIELGILRQERFPQCQIYSNYTFYGSDRNDIEEALKNLEERNWVVGMVISIPIFQGFKTLISEKRLKLEIEKMELERGKKIAELKNLYSKTSKTIFSYNQEIETKKELLRNIQNKTDMLERLSNLQITERVVFLKQKIDLINQRLELEKTLVNKISAIKKLNIICDSVWPNTSVWGEHIGSPLQQRKGN